MFLSEENLGDSTVFLSEESLGEEGRNGEKPHFSPYKAGELPRGHGLFLLGSAAQIKLRKHLERPGEAEGYVTNRASQQLLCSSDQKGRLRASPVCPLLSFAAVKHRPPQSERLKTTEVNGLPVLEARSLKSRCQ